jgi:hypothetical protein
MMESEWLARDDPEPMLKHIRGYDNNRKWRLFAAACGRRIWHCLNESQRAVVEEMERNADRNEADLLDLRTFIGVPDSSAFTYTSPHAVSFTPGAWMACIISGNAIAAMDLLPEGSCTEIKAEAQLVRDIVGNPFHPPSPIDSSWLDWNSRAVVRLAQEIYNQRSFERIPELGEALRAAGCSNSAVLVHCREPAPHVRGCWVVDLLLGKE